MKYEVRIQLLRKERTILLRAAPAPSGQYLSHLSLCIPICLPDKTQFLKGRNYILIICVPITSVHSGHLPERWQMNAVSAPNQKDICSWSRQGFGCLAACIFLVLVTGQLWGCLETYEMLPEPPSSIGSVRCHKESCLTDSRQIRATLETT